jgi:hypothetical protein
MSENPYRRAERKDDGLADFLKKIFARYESDLKNLSKRRDFLDKIKRSGADIIGCKLADEKNSKIEITAAVQSSNYSFRIGECVIRFRDAKVQSLWEKRNVLFSDLKFGIRVIENLRIESRKSLDQDDQDFKEVFEKVRHGKTKEKLENDFSEAEKRYWEALQRFKNFENVGGMRKVALKEFLIEDTRIEDLKKQEIEIENEYKLLRTELVAIEELYNEIIYAFKRVF